MARQKQSVLSVNTANKKEMKFKVDPRLEEDLRRLDERIAREAPDKLFDRNAVVERALKRALDEANEVLDAARPAPASASEPPVSVR